MSACVDPVSVQFANAQLPLFGGDLMSESTAYVLNLVNIYLEGAAGARTLRIPIRAAQRANASANFKITFISVFRT